MSASTTAWREIRGLLRLAGPVIAVHLGMMTMGTVDVMMLGRVDDIALAAGALGNSVGFAILMFPMGVLMALGENTPRRVKNPSVP